MAAVGNHGIIIPRNKKLLHRMYWNEKKSLVQIASLWGVNPNSLARVFDELGIKRRKRRTKEAHPDRGCIICGAQVFRIRHAGNGTLYGRRCKKHWNEHRANLVREECKFPEFKAKRKRWHERWYYEGPLNPQGESQWLSKGRSLLRTARRYLTKPETRAAFRSQKTESEPEQISRI